MELICEARALGTDDTHPPQKGTVQDGWPGPCAGCRNSQAGAPARSLQPLCTTCPQLYAFGRCCSLRFLVDQVVQTSSRQEAIPPLSG